jgi:hypothetical protein
MEYPLHDLLWIEELLPPGYEAIPKYGGMAYYLDMKLVMILVEKRIGGYEHKGVSYPFQLWHGCILPVEQKKQSAFFLKFLFLENHPANKDWLYIPAESEDFESEVKQFIREITKRNLLLGIPVKVKAPKAVDEAADGKTASRAPGRSARPKNPVKKTNADKKHENKFLLGMLSKRIK